MNASERIAKIASKLEADRIRAEQKAELERIEAERIAAEEAERLQQAKDAVEALRPRVEEIVDVLVYIKQNDPEKWKECETTILKKFGDYAFNILEEGKEGNYDNGLNAENKSGDHVRLYLNDDFVHYVNRTDEPSRILSKFVYEFNQLENRFDEWFTKTYDPKLAEQQEYQSGMVNFLNNVYLRLEDYINDTEPLRPYAIVTDPFTSGGCITDGAANLLLYVIERQVYEKGALLHQLNSDKAQPVCIYLSELDNLLLSDVFESEDKSEAERAETLKDALVKVLDEKVPELFAKKDEQSKTDKSQKDKKTKKDKPIERD